MESPGAVPGSRLMWGMLSVGPSGWERPESLRLRRLAPLHRRS